MQESIKVNDILQTVSALSLDEQRFIVETINKRIHELRRNQIAERAEEAEHNYRTGKVTSGTVDDLMRSLDSETN